VEACLLFGLLIVLIALSVPIGITLGLATTLSLVLTTDVPLVMIAQKSFSALDSFPLLAIPFFMLAGALMSYGGISRRLVVLAETLVGFIVGGLAMVTVLACMFFAAISGSGPATVSAIGSFMVPAMRERNYAGGFAAAVTAAAGTIGVIIPPSIPFVIYAVVAGASVGELFLAGIIPGILIGTAMMLVCYVIARKRNYLSTAEPPSLRKVLRAFREAVWALIVPVIILGGIYGGIFTPTEAAVVAVVYSLFIGRFVYRELNFRTTYDAFKDAVLVNGATSFMIGLSMAFAAYLSMDQIPAKLGALLLSVSSSPVVTLLILNVFLLIVGCFVDNIPAVIILTPILLPIVTQIGVDPVHFGLIMTVNLAIGFITPPYGINLFVASAISGESIEDISREVLPLIVAMIACLLLITYVPATSMWLVHLLRQG
jgi:C4-dicarboxylate transporter DctM subunit